MRAHGAVRPLKKPKPHENGVLTANSWHWAATPQGASEIYTDVVERLRTRRLTSVTISLVHEGRVVHETVLPEPQHCQA